MQERGPRAGPVTDAPRTDSPRSEILLTAVDLQNAIVNSANVSSIATDAHALVWQPDPGGAKEPACVKLTFHPLNACDPAFHEALYACIIETPLEFAVCYNGATPASVGWPGVQQVELEPLPLGQGAP